MIIDFLKTKRSKKELKITLEILREFRTNDSNEEWVKFPFITWEKIDRLEEFLSHLVEGTKLQDDTLKMIKESKM